MISIYIYIIGSVLVVGISGKDDSTPSATGMMDKIFFLPEKRVDTSYFRWNNNLEGSMPFQIRRK